MTNNWTTIWTVLSISSPGHRNLTDTSPLVSPTNARVSRDGGAHTNGIRSTVMNSINSGHLIQSAIAHFRATGKRTFLDVAIRNADLVCKTFGPCRGTDPPPVGTPWIVEWRSVNYKVTGTKKYLDMAKYFVGGTNRRSPEQTSQDHKPILQIGRSWDMPSGLGTCIRAWPTLASRNDATAYFQALTRIWDNMAQKLYITGGIGSRAEAGLRSRLKPNNMTALYRGCASIANVTGTIGCSSLRANRNTMTCSRGPYITVWYRACRWAATSSSTTTRWRAWDSTNNRGSGCARCPGNITRFMASVPYCMPPRATISVVNLYIQGKLDIKTDQCTDPDDCSIMGRQCDGDGESGQESRGRHSVCVYRDGHRMLRCQPTGTRLLTRRNPIPSRWTVPRWRTWNRTAMVHRAPLAQRRPCGTGHADGRAPGESQRQCGGRPG